MSEEIKEAVERLKEDIYFWGKYEKDIKILLNLAEQYLAVEGFPEKKEHCVASGDYEKFKGFGYNQAIDDCKLVLLKRLDGVEEIIVNSHFNFDIYLKNLQDKTKRISIDKFISDAIKQYLVGGKK